MRPEVAAETREWLERAVEDLRETEHDLAATPPLLRGAVFHAQQATEKALKAFLTAHERPFRRTHDLDELGREVEAIDPSLAAVVTPARDLTPYAWRFRYPGTPLAPTEEEARTALGLARAVYAAVVARLPGEVRP
ncbi:MAG TPA: HEPN domain-containing protein [Chloroflexota bacterium]|nr:HEPN domain-containing protein [Chloroflexota bacterium]